jgi:hypothetical protein
LPCKGALMPRKYEYVEGSDAKASFDGAMRTLFKAPKQAIKKGPKTPAPSKKRGKDAP